MSVDPDLSFIGVDVDPEKVEPIDLKKLIVSVNEFLIRSCDILNNFAGKMEESILELEYRLDRVETELLLLEKRLENVPDTDVVPSTSSIEKPTETNITTTSNVELKSEIKHEQIILPEVPLESEQKLEEKEENGEPVVKIKDHPSYAMYFKMLKLGVPEAAVRQKMITEGIDPSILSKPDAPAPMLPSKSQKKDLAKHSDSDVHSDSSFSGAD